MAPSLVFWLNLVSCYQLHETYRRLADFLNGNVLPRFVEGLILSVRGIEVLDWKEVSSS
jgi:hypothetical protein